MKKRAYYMTKDEFLKKYYRGIDKDIPRPKKGVNKKIKDRSALFFKKKRLEKEAEKESEREALEEKDRNRGVGIGRGLSAGLAVFSALLGTKAQTDRKFRVGDRVRVKYRGQEGIVVDINGNTYMVSIHDGDYVDSYYEDQLEKAW